MSQQVSYISLHKSYKFHQTKNSSSSSRESYFDFITARSTSVSPPPWKIQCVMHIEPALTPLFVLGPTMNQQPKPGMLFSLISGFIALHVSRSQPAPLFCIRLEHQTNTLDQINQNCYDSNEPVVSFVGVGCPVSS